jgi:hypothetical protein
MPVSWAAGDLRKYFIEDENISFLMPTRYRYNSWELGLQYLRQCYGASYNTKPFLKPIIVRKHLIARKRVTKQLSPNRAPLSMDSHPQN